MRANEVLDSEQWMFYGGIFDFIGSELLSPMNRSGRTVGLDPEFWQSAPVPNNDCGEQGVARLEAYAQSCEQGAGDDDPSVPGVMQTSAEYVRLFIGPPSPAASPWETINLGGGTVGFGKATLEMRELLVAEGLELDDAVGQYEDHIGVELLYLSLLCKKAAEDGANLSQGIREFVDAHPLCFIGNLRDAVDAAFPDGYYSALLEYAHGLLLSLHEAPDSPGSYQ